jgi:hypothetical protein
VEEVKLGVIYSTPVEEKVNEPVEAMSTTSDEVKVPKALDRIRELKDKRKKQNAEIVSESAETTIKTIEQPSGEEVNNHAENLEQPENKDLDSNENKEQMDNEADKQDEHEKN